MLSNAFCQTIKKQALTCASCGFCIVAGFPRWSSCVDESRTSARLLTFERNLKNTFIKHNKGSNCQGFLSLYALPQSDCAHARRAQLSADVSAGDLSWEVTSTHSFTHSPPRSGAWGLFPQLKSNRLADSRHIFSIVTSPSEDDNLRHNNNKRHAGDTESPAEALHVQRLPNDASCISASWSAAQRAHLAFLLPRF